MKAENDFTASVEDLVIFDASMNFVAINQTFNAIIARVAPEQRSVFGIACNQQYMISISQFLSDSNGPQPWKV